MSAAVVGGCPSMSNAHLMRIHLLLLTTIMQTASKVAIQGSRIVCVRYVAHFLEIRNVFEIPDAHDLSLCFSPRQLTCFNESTPSPLSSFPRISEYPLYGHVHVTASGDWIASTTPYRLGQTQQTRGVATVLGQRSRSTASQASETADSMPLVKLRTPMQRIRCYTCSSAVYLTGFDPSRGAYRILEINRNQTEGGAKGLGVQQDPQVFTASRLQHRMAEIATQHPDLMLNCENVFGILGFIQLLESCYLILITETSKVGTIMGHFLYSVDKTMMLQLSNKARVSADETRYKNIFQALDLTKGFYFSYAYDLTNTLQHNMTVHPRTRHRARKASVSSTQSEIPEYVRCNEMFVWNAFLLKPLLALNERAIGDLAVDAWVLPVIHGFIEQRSFRLFCGDVVKLTLISRRSRCFAGCRYLRRGVNDHGFVANEVESEQIVSREPHGLCIRQRHAAMVQLRGSIPLFWSHTNYFSPKPDIQLDTDLEDITATRKHFMRLFNRYGLHVTCLSLLRQVEKKPKEAIVGKAFGRVVGSVNAYMHDATNPQGGSVTHGLDDDASLSERDVDESSTTHDSLSNRAGLRVSASTTSGDDGMLPVVLSQDGLPIDYITYDFLHNAHNAKERGISVFDALAQLSETIFPTMGIFVEGVDEQYTTWAGNADEMLAQARNGCGMKQFGVLRTNCIDCLDRTNVAQFCYARANLVHMLRGLGIDLHPGALAEVWRILLEMWAENGDRMAKQYGGSGAMHKVDDVAGEVDGERELVLTGGAKNALVAVKRYYSNAMTDFERQQAIDLLLGVYVPNKAEKPIWETRLRPDDYRERGNADQLLAEADARETQAEVAAWRTLAESIYLRTHGHWTTFAHDGQQPGELTSLAEVTNLPFQNLVLDDVTFYPWGPSRLAKQQEPTTPPPPASRPAASSTATTQGWNPFAEDEATKDVYTRYVNLERAILSSSPPSAARSVPSPPIARGTYTDRLQARKRELSVRLEKEQLAIPPQPSPPTHHVTLTPTSSRHISTDRSGSVTRKQSAAVQSDATILATLLETETLRANPQVSEQRGMSFFPEHPGNEETKSNPDTSKTMKKKKSMSFFKRFGGHTEDEAQPTQPATPPGVPEKEVERKPSDPIDDKQRMPPTIHDYIDHVISRSLDRKLNELKLENAKLKDVISNLVSQQAGLAEAVEASGWTGTRNL